MTHIRASSSTNSAVGCERWWHRKAAGRKSVTSGRLFAFTPAECKFLFYGHVKFTMRAKGTQKWRIRRCNKTVHSRRTCAWLMRLCAVGIVVLVFASDFAELWLPGTPGESRVRRPCVGVAVVRAGCRELTSRDARRVTFLTHHSHGELIIDYVSFEGSENAISKVIKFSHASAQPTPRQPPKWN